MSTHVWAVLTVNYWFRSAFCVIFYHFVLVFAFVVLGLVLTYLLSCTVSEIQPLIGPKSLYLATDLCKIFHGCQWMAKVPNGIEKLWKISTGWVGCTNVTDDRQATACSLKMARRSVKYVQHCSYCEHKNMVTAGNLCFQRVHCSGLNSQTCKQVH